MKSESIMIKTSTSLKNTARITGFWYLMLAITGVLGFMVFHDRVFTAGDPEKTLTQLIDMESTARVRLALEMAIVISQALTAVWFYKLFRHVNEWAAWTMGIWGTVNAVVIMVSAIAMASAISIANTAVMPDQERIVSIGLLQSLISNAWGIGGLFFGLWLFPMGYIVSKFKIMPVWLGRVILLGGAGYLLSTVSRYLGIEFSYNRILILPATIGEFWMIGYLLLFGIRTDKKLS